jgi:hypothetical protein
MNEANIFAYYSWNLFQKACNAAWTVDIHRDVFMLASVVEQLSKTPKEVLKN